MNDTQLLKRLAEANAYPENTPLPEAIWTRALALREIERRAGKEPTGTEPMGSKPPVAADQHTTTRTAAEPDFSDTPEPVLVSERRRPQGLLVGLGAFAAAVVTVAVVFVVVPRGEPVPSIPLVELGDDPGAREAFAAVEAAFFASNSGNLEAWSTARNAGSAFPSEAIRESVITSDMNFHAAAHALGSRLDVAECVSSGFGDWPGTADEGVPRGYLFTCEVIETNELHTAGGVLITERYTWVVMDGEIVAAGTSDAEGEEEWDRFLTDFRRWLSENQADAYSAMQFDSNGFPLVQSVPLALQYVDQFVADSADWPIIVESEGSTDAR